MSNLQHAYQAEGAEFLDDMDFGDLSGVNENEFALLPPGRYRLMATACELKDSKSGGKYVWVEFTICEGQAEGRKVFENYNLQHSNPDTVRIAQRQVKQWIIACGLDGDQRLTMKLIRSLEGKEFFARVDVQKSKDPQYQDQNRIKVFEMPNSAPTATYAEQPAATASAPKVKKPWEK